MKERDWSHFLDSPNLNNPPKVSIIIPTHNSAQVIGATLDSLLAQKYPSFEIIIIDASSKDRTLEVIAGYEKSLIRVYTVASYNRYEILNKGISLADGEYINFLFPGDFYIARDTLHHMMVTAEQANFPDFCYCGCLLRESRAEAKSLYRPFSQELLKGGQQPTSLQSFWFKRTLFKEVGKFNTSYRLRGGYDLLCRISQSNKFTMAGTHRILTDYDLNWITRHAVFYHFLETLHTVYTYFGAKKALYWLWKQKNLKRLYKLWRRKLATALKGK